MINKDSIILGCDKILTSLRENPDSFKPLGLLFEQHKLDIEILPSVFETLMENDHIEAKPNVYRYADVRIKPDGLDFISRTSYDECRDNGVVKIIGSMSTIPLPQRKHYKLLAEAAKFKVGIDERPKEWKLWGLTKFEVLTIFFLLLGGITAIATCTRTH
jgi:hypothetical protein